MTENFVEMYLKELSEITPCDTAENERLLRNLRGGDDAKARLIEGNLRLVLDEALALESCGLPVGDLISEGNIALVAAVDEVEQSAIVQNGEAFAGLLKKRIHEGMVRFIDEEGAAKLSEAKLEEEVNRLMLLTKNFEEENGRPATLEELAKLSGLSEDETEELVRISYSAMQLGDKAENAGSAPNTGKNPLKDGWKF